MSRKIQIRKPLTVAIGAALATTFGAAAAANVEANPFALTALGSGYMAADAGEGKCGEGKCGGGKSAMMGDEDMYKTMDKNSDGEVDQAEHAAYWDGRFDKWDQNKDEQLTESEFTAAKKMRHDDKGDMAEGGGKGDKGTKLSEKMDLNESASVDRTEFTAWWDAKFEAADTNDDMALSREEMHAAYEKMHSEMHGETGMEDA